MKRIASSVFMLMLSAVIALSGSITAYAAALPEGKAPDYPEPAVTAPINAFDLPTLPPDDQADTPAPIDAVLYPSSIHEIEENGVNWIVKVYELSEADDPQAISQDAFERDGWRYELSDITKKETATADMREHIETVTADSATKDMQEIIALFEQTMEYSSEDGYAGMLTLDIASITVETAGSKTSSYTVSATREYPHLSRNDTALIPKTITDNGRSLTLQDVEWQAQSTVTVDYDVLPESYTAIATYTTTGSRTVVTGYTATAEYKGELVKLLPGRTVYSAYFIGTEIEPPAPEPEPEAPSANPLPVAAGATASTGLLGGVVFFFFFRRNVRVFNLKDGKYVPIGKTRAANKSPVINLTPFADKAVTGSFILVLDKLAAKSLSGKVVSVNYGDKSFQHIVDGSGGEYQFEVDF